VRLHASLRKHPECEKHAGASELSVQLEYGPEAVTLEVTDDGRGGALERAAAASPGHFGLTGMRERAVEIGATLKVSSTLGEGTTIRLSVPARNERANRRGTKVTAEPIRVLVVEDHNVCARGCGAAECGRGLEVVGEAADGVEAIAQYRKLQPDITLIDLRMPRMSGVDVIERIRMETPRRGSSY